MVEIDDLLGGAPVQHNEFQGHESALFQSKFKQTGLTYLDGGVASGFTHVEKDVYEPRLLHLKGKRNVRCRQVPVASSSLNDGDVFILDLGLTLYQFNGKQANRWEKTKGLEMSRNIRDNERGGRATVVVVESGEDNAEFWAALGGKGPVAAAIEDQDEAAAPATAPKLFKVSDATGSLVTTQITEAPLRQDHLDTNDVFILDIGSEVFVWIGKGSTADEKKAGMKNARDYIASSGLPARTPVTRIVEGSETVLFKDKFKGWKVANALLPGQVVSHGAGRGIAARQEQKEIDFAALHSAKNAAKETRPTLDPAGTIQVWRIENFAKVDVPAASHGQFYSGDSFIVLYTWPSKSNQKPIIYFWQGRSSSTDEKGASALLAQQLDQSMGGLAVQVRVVQGKEPNDFLSLFKGRMVVHEGGVASGFKNKKDADSFDTDGISLFHVKGTTTDNTRAVQVAETASSLNSCDAFVLLTEPTMFVWSGRGATADESAYASAIAELLKGSRSVEHLKEGEEPEAFWAALGGKGEYPQAGEPDAPHAAPRLFEISDASGVITVEEIFDFAQEDLRGDNIHLLDVYSAVFVWVGSEATAREKSSAFELAQKFIASATDGRDADTPVIRVDQGQEPPTFTAHFLGWDSSKTQAFEDPYEKARAAATAANPAKAAPAAAAAPASAASPAKHDGPKHDSAINKASAVPAQTSAAPKAAPSVAPPSGNYADPATKKYTYDELLARPDDVDPSQREQYLSDAEFLKVIGVPRAEFNAFKKWKMDEKKKAVKLF
jgi:advillin